jgi:Galactose oxidase-like, Early set domain/Bacterial Ig domain
VQTPDNDVTKATLMAPSAVTHAVDMNQRFVALQVSRHNHCVELKAPANGRVAPAGWYMLFLLNDQGVPSKAKWVKLQDGGSDTSCSGPTLDTTPPTDVSVSAPNGSLSGEVTLTAGATDNVGVTRLEFRVDGALIDADTSPPAPFSVPWDTGTVGNGAHTLTAVAYDARGNFTTSPPVSVTVANAPAADITGPSVWLTFPSAGATLGGTVTLTAGATDDVAVAGVRFTLDGHSLGGEDAAAPYSLAWSTSSVGNGSHTLSAVARDAAGNTSTAATVAVTVSNAIKGSPPPDDPPTITGLKLSSASFRKNSTISFRLSEAARVTLSFERKLSGRKRHGKCVTGARKGARCTLYRKLASKITVDGTTGPNSLRLGRRGMAAGSYRLTLVATDSSGKRSEKARAGFRLIASAAHKSRTSAIEAAIRRVELAF